MRYFNLKILTIVITITFLGLFTIYSNTSQREQVASQQLFIRQLLWFFFALIGLFIFYRWDYRRLWDYVYIIYAITLLLLILVAILGNTRLGAQRWLKIFWFNFQPAELAKLTTVIFLARYFSQKSVQDMQSSVRSFGIFKSLILPLCILALPILLILEQPDLGSAAMLFFIFLGLVYLADVKLKYLFALLLVFLLCTPLFWHFLREYQKERLTVFLNPNVDPLGAGYTMIQSKIAIGSGSFLGKGWLSGTQGQLRFLPESHTDFIFATFSEEWGFLGTIILLLFYYLLIRWGLEIADKTEDRFGKLLAGGISLSFAIQISINISMTLGFAPVVGLPLILMSYGGSSIVMSYIAIGILLNINKKRNLF